MNYPTKNGQIDPNFLRKVWDKSGLINRKHVIDTLLAAQEIMQEMQPNIKVGQKVKHIDWPDNVLGRVTRISASGKRAKVRWEGDSYDDSYTFENLLVIEEAQHGEG